jgi:hypothetical protein
MRVVRRSTNNCRPIVTRTRRDGIVMAYIYIINNNLLDTVRLTNLSIESLLIKINHSMTHLHTCIRREYSSGDNSSRQIN